MEDSMKKLFALVFAALVLALASCSNSSGGGGPTSLGYTLEQGKVAKSDKNEAAGWPTATFANRKGIRDGMNSKTTSDYLKMTLTEAALKNWIKKLNKTEEEANQIVADINSVGNYALLVDDPDDTQKAWWFYVVKD
jgi:hypothetical protein